MRKKKTISFLLGIVSLSSFSGCARGEAKASLISTELEVKKSHYIEDVTLNSGYKMPVIGIGTYTLSNADAENSVYHA